MIALLTVLSFFSDCKIFLTSSSSLKKLNEWKNILDLIPSKFKKNIQLKKSGVCGLFSASLELSREGLISIMQKKTFDRLLIKEKK